MDWLFKQLQGKISRNQYAISFTTKSKDNKHNLKEHTVSNQTGSYYVVVNCLRLTNELGTIPGYSENL